MGSRKRKADEDDSGDSPLDRMASSPSPAPSSLPRLHSNAAPRSTKRLRTNTAGRPLSLPRLLETLSKDELSSIVQSICNRHPQLGNEIVNTAPRPSVSSALDVLRNYQRKLEQSFPYGDRPSSDYAYNRVRQPLVDLIDALRDFTPHFLPPNEQQPAVALEFLDDVTSIIHELPQWDSYQHSRHKQEAYEEIDRAWALVGREAAKRGAGMQLHHGNWDQKLAKHNEVSGGKLQQAMEEFKSSLGWMASSTIPGHGSQEDSMSIKQQLLSGTYGTDPIRVGW